MKTEQKSCEDYARHHKEERTSPKPHLTLCRLFLKGFAFPRCIAKS